MHGTSGSTYNTLPLYLRILDHIKSACTRPPLHSEQGTSPQFQAIKHAIRMCIQAIIYNYLCVCTLTKHLLCNEYITLTAKQISNAPCAALNFRYVELADGGCLDSRDHNLLATRRRRWEKKMVPPRCCSSHQVQYLVEWRHEGLPNRAFLEPKVEDDKGTYSPKCYRGGWLKSEEHDCCFGIDHEEYWRHVDSIGLSKKQDNPHVNIGDEDDVPAPRRNRRSKRERAKKHTVLGSKKVTKSTHSSAIPRAAHGTVTQTKADKLARSVSDYTKNRIDRAEAQNQQTPKEVHTLKKAYQAAKSKSTHTYKTSSSHYNEDSDRGSSTETEGFVLEYMKVKRAAHDEQMTGLEIGVNNIDITHEPQSGHRKKLSSDAGTKGPLKVAGGSTVKSESNKSIFNDLPTKFNYPPTNFTDSFYVPNAGYGASLHYNKIMTQGSPFGQSMTSATTNNPSFSSTPINAQARAFEF
ncbi:hypothetical protein BJ875DRAFT_524365 [Amylocarpus encephaloides]|uniref:Uncharacterized protein n=1 Tax=Amylocarpus encephaloides TaxID=45428 RepID=A0A9P8C0R0_9HELO|nr:hypothetical protein BJ875DRAFT_524365 [Amylocarpus encephaloides]